MDQIRNLHSECGCWYQSFCASSTVGRFLIEDGELNAVHESQLLMPIQMSKTHNDGEDSLNKD